jgi:hypothetical protein
MKVSTRVVSAPTAEIQKERLVSVSAGRDSRAVLSSAERTLRWR